ncbi:hypothetical protein AG1IA_09989 [Rhizoctonia solani AG-1 IA]|uniref:Uncharacterized protein n=1 Tax=Thanatephorus cucumeris (strain AG1-IA) TaxID=983506 RepID=L8WCT0_THACA|nr:hypothetical protein AG1IA_09989 [Rhizoctonia solani AG-1 IA]
MRRGLCERYDERPIFVPLFAKIPDCLCLPQNGINIAVAYKVEYIIRQGCR